MSKRVYVKGHWRRGKNNSWCSGCSGCLGVVLIIFFLIFFSIILSDYSNLDIRKRDLSSVIVQQKKKNNKVEEKKLESKTDTVSKIENSNKESDGVGICGGLCIFPILIIGAVFAVIIIARIMKNVSKKKAEIKDKKEYEEFLETEEKRKKERKIERKKLLEAEEKREKEREINKEEYLASLEEFKDKLNDSVAKFNMENSSSLKDEIQNYFKKLLERLSNLEYSTEGSIDIEHPKAYIIEEIFSDQIKEIKADKYLSKSEVDYLDIVSQLLGFEIQKYFEKDLDTLAMLTKIKNGVVTPLKTRLNLRGEEKVYWHGPIKISNIIRNKLVYDKTDSKLYLTNENIIIQGNTTFSIKLDSIVSIKKTTASLDNYEVKEEFGNFKITYKPQSQFKELQFLAGKIWMEILKAYINFFTKQKN